MKTSKMIEKKKRTPKGITRIFDNGGRTRDRYSFILPDKRLVTCCMNPFGAFGTSNSSWWKGGSTQGLGLRIERQELPEKSLKYLTICERLLDEKIY